MKGKPLTVGQPSVAILTLQDEIRRGAEFRYCHRLHAVLLVAQGMNCCQVAELLGDDRRTVEGWVHRFAAKGLTGLQERARRGRPPRLTPQQVAEIQDALRKPPRDFALSGDSWNGRTLAAYIERAYGVKLGARQCRRFFRPWGFRPVKRRKKHG